MVDDNLEGEPFIVNQEDLLLTYVPNKDSFYDLTNEDNKNKSLEIQNILPDYT